MLGRKTSIRMLLAVLVGSLTVPLLVLLVFSWHQEVERERAALEEELQGLAETVALSVQQFLDDSERLMAGLAMDPQFDPMEGETCEVRLSSLRHLLLPTYTNILILRPDGSLVCSLLAQPPEALEAPDPPWLEEALAAKGFHVGAVWEGARSQRWTSILSHPIRDSGGEKIGIVILGLDLLRLRSILAKTEPLLGPGIVTITAEDGTVVTRTRDPEAWIGQRAPSGYTPSPDDPDHADQGFSTARTFEGTPFLWGFKRLPGPDWTVYAGVPLEGLPYSPFELWPRVIRSSLLVLFVLGVAFLLAWWVYRRITRPLRSLVTGTSDADPGNPTPLKVEGPREIAHVARHFNEAWNARIRAVAEGERSSERIRSLFENAVTGIYVATEDGRFLEVNQALVELLGYDSREELLATPLERLYHSAEEREELLAEVEGRDEVEGKQVEWKQKDGTPIRVRLFARHLLTDSGDAAWEVIVEDVTELTNLQEQYLQSQKMEALGRLAGGIAHDFNNLLTVVQGQTALLLEDPRLDEDLRVQLREIMEAGERGTALNRQLLAFGRRSSSSRSVLDLNAITRNFEVMLHRAAGEETRIQLHLAPDLPGILGDRSQMEQIIMNLVVNARDAMPRGGTILIETYHALVSPEEGRRYPDRHPGPHTVLAVSDTGSGMDPEVQRHIFEPFFTTKPESRGTGLGLSTVYGIVADAGGHIRVETDPGEGTTFRVFLPSRTVEEKQEATQEGEDTRGATPGIVLLAEDEDSVRKLAQTILERAGFRVLAAEDGADARDLARKFEGVIDVLVSDVVMPELRGPELAAGLAAEGLVQRAVLFSGYPEGMREGGPDGVKAWAFIPKPFTSAELLGAIREVMEKNDSSDGVNGGK